MGLHGTCADLCLTAENLGVRKQREDRFEVRPLVPSKKLLVGVAMKGCGGSCLVSTFENQAMLLHNVALQLQKGNSALHLSRVVTINALILKAQWHFNVFFMVY